MSRTICGFVAAGLLAVSLPILASTTIGARAAPDSGASQPGIDTPASEPTDFSSRGGGGRGGGGGFRGGGGRGGGGGFRGGGGRGGGGYRGGGGRGGGGYRGGGGHRGGASSRGGGTRSGATRGGGTRSGTTRSGTTRSGTTRSGTTRSGTTRSGTTRSGTTRSGTTRSGTTRSGTTRSGTTRTGTSGTTRTGTSGTTRTGTSGTTRTGTTHTGTTRTGTTRTGTTRTGTTRTGTTRTGTTRAGTTRTGSTRGGITNVRNRRVTTFTGRRFWWRGGWRSLIGISLLTGFAVGGDFYYPEGYLALGQPACTGYSDDGCALRWQDVAADDGSTIPQCVQFCPRVRKTPPSTPAPAAAAPRGTCEVEVFKDPNLAGGSFRTSEDQPLLNDDWDKKIASINVISGTWDFMTDQQYNGDAMRLSPGTYRDLGPNWVDQISSFMCAQ